MEAETKHVLNLVKAHFTKGEELYLKHISIDCVIFSFHETDLKVLLLHSKFVNQWALPGGFVNRTEHLDDAAHRVLKERTGVSDLFLHQFHVFSSPNRSNEKAYRLFLEKHGLSVTKSWMFDRFLSVGYTALADYAKVFAEPDEFSQQCVWHSVHQLPDMMMDHRHIIETALDQLRMNLNHQPIGYNLLPVKFTMPELQKLYEAILGRNLDRRNFQRKILATGILKKLAERRQGVAHKAPNFYKFDVKRYNRALQTGLGFQL